MRTTMSAATCAHDALESQSRPASRRWIALFLALTVPFSSGCSFFNEKTQTVTIRPSDPEAEIVIDGQPRGKGDVQVSLVRNKSYIVIAKVGDREGRASIGTTLSQMGILDIVGGIFFLVPFVGLIAPGAFDLEPTDVLVHIPDTADSPGRSDTPRRDADATEGGDFEW